MLGSDVARSLAGPFLGACALHRRVGLTANEAGDMALKRAMIDGAAQRMVLTDASKLDTVAPHAVCALAELDRVICDAAPAWLRKQVTVEVVSVLPVRVTVDYIDECSR